MIQGRVLATGEAVTRVKLRGPSGQMANVEAMIDTGFTDQLTLANWVIERLALQFDAEATYYLADGEAVLSRMFHAEIEWMGTWRETLVTQVEGSPLLGMGLLQGCHLGMDVIDGGEIEIRPLPAAGLL